MNPLLILATALLISGPAYVLDGDAVVVLSFTSGSKASMPANSKASAPRSRGLR